LAVFVETLAGGSFHRIVSLRSTCFLPVDFFIFVCLLLKKYRLAGAFAEKAATADKLIPAIDVRF
jgi:hypothetical protein